MYILYVLNENSLLVYANDLIICSPITQNNRELFDAERKSPAWQDYVAYLDEMVIEGFAQIAGEMMKNYYRFMARLKYLCECTVMLLQV